MLFIVPEARSKVAIGGYADPKGVGRCGVK